MSLQAKLVNFLKVGFLALVVGLGALLAAPAATAAPAAQSPQIAAVAMNKAAEMGPQASWSCGNWYIGYSSWSADCRVYSGQLRSITYCSNATRYGAWVGAGYWKFRGDCYGARLDGIGLQDRY